MPLFGAKPETSITVKVNQLCRRRQNADLEDDSMEVFLDDLVHLIKLQRDAGATECARAVRKVIKYGSVEEQLDALQLLELLLMNLGPRIGPVVASDTKLVDVLKGILTGQGKTGTLTAYDRRVRLRARAMALEWRLEFQDMDGYKYMALLWKFAGRARSNPATPQMDNELAFSDRFSPGEQFYSPRLYLLPRDEHEEKRLPPPRPTTKLPYSQAEAKKKARKEKKKRHVLDGQYKVRQINYKVEGPRIRDTIASAYTHALALKLALLQLRAGQDPFDNGQVVAEFEKCKKVRRLVLKYLQYVGVGDGEGRLQEWRDMDSEFLGTLIMANEHLVTTFKQFDRACGYNLDNAPSYNEPLSDESFYESTSLDELVHLDQLKLDHKGQTEDLSDRLQLAVKAKPAKPAKPEALKSSFHSTNPFGDAFVPKSA